MISLKDVRDGLREANVLLDRGAANCHILVRAILEKAIHDLQEYEAGEEDGTDTSERSEG